VSEAILSSPAGRAAAESKGWIASPAYDLALFTLSPLAGLFVLWANFNLPGGTMVVVAATFLIAIPHYLSSFTFYLGDDTLAYYRSRRMAFFIGPMVIVAAVVVLRVLGFDRPVLNAMYVWNIWHVSLQSAGILSLYRRLNGGALSERRPAHLAILSVNATLAFWHIDRFAPLYSLLIRIHPVAPWSIRAVGLPVAVASLIVLAARLARRPHPVSLAEGAFLASSLLLFHPYLWVQDSNLATFGMLMGHFIQYLAIVWLLHRRKYADAGGSFHQRLLGRISARPALTLSAIAAMGLTFYAFSVGAEAVGASMFYIIAWNALTLVHFYLDGLIWAFRQTFVRQTFGPYLTPASHMVGP